MQLKNAKEALRAFGKYVVQQSRSRLTKDKKNNTKGLYESLGYDVYDGEGIVGIELYMEEYGIYIDQGVKGANPSLVKNGKQKAPNSDYKFKNKRPPMSPLKKWAKQRKIRLRDEKGRFKKGNYNTIAFILQRSIYAQGIKPTFFFTKPFERAFKRFPKNILDAWENDIIQMGLTKNIK